MQGLHCLCVAGLGSALAGFQHSQSMSHVASADSRSMTDRQIQDEGYGAYHSSAGQEYEAWHSFCLVHSRYICQVIELVPDVMFQEEDTSLLLVCFLTQLPAILQNLFANSTRLHTKRDWFVGGTEEKCR